MRGNLDCRNLEIKELVAKVTWETKLADSSARFLRQMVGHFDVDMIRRDGFLASPAFLKDR
ncbi:hypothetical protein D3C83_142110 [compost metagenome]